MKEKNALYFVNIFLGAAIIAVTTLFLLQVVSDPDFFWHLKTGEWIWQNMGLPSHDPFSYTTPSLGSARERFILTSYWLSQVSYHLIHSVAGMSGIVFLRFLVLAALVYVMTKRRHGDHTVYLGLLLIFVTMLLRLYTADRPQVFSFLFFGVLLLLLDRIRHDEPTGYYGLPVLMLLWANTHGGYILGQAVIALYMVMEGVKFLRPGMLSPLAPESYRKLLLAGAAGIACSFINPNTYNAWPVMMDMSSFMTSTNAEYLSSPELFLRFNEYGILPYGFLLLLTAVGVLANIKKIDVTEAALLAATGYFSFTQNRYIAFFLIAAVPAAGRLFSGNPVLPWARSFILFAAIFVSLFFSKDQLINIHRIGSGRWIYNHLPVQASDFISSHKLAGNMYNDYTWGGYLIWRLGPEKKVFIDGRALHEFVYALFQRIDAADKSSCGGVPFWKAVLASYNVGYIIIPFYDQSTGDMVPLVKALYHDKDWVPVFMDSFSVVFVKDTPENRQVIAEARRSIKKENFGKSMLYMIDLQIQSDPGNATLHIAKGDLYLSMQQVQEARAEYEKAVKLAPFNTKAKQQLLQLKATGK
jgi:hypothetical protein